MPGPMDESQRKTERIEKPNLRGFSPYSKQKKVLILGAILVGIYMYPTIVKPLFHIGFENEDESTEKKELLNKMRPSFMPEWSSPFAGSARDD